MPIYVFECPVCKKTTEKITTNMDLREIECPLCFTGQARKVAVAGSFKINGYSEKNGYSKKEE
jgi:putative FmdB family regulatory protein